MTTDWHTALSTELPTGQVQRVGVCGVLRQYICIPLPSCNVRGPLRKRGRKNVKARRWGPGWSGDSWIQQDQCSYELSSLAACTGPEQDQARHHSSLEWMGAHELSPTDTWSLQEGQFSLRLWPLVHPPCSNGGQAPYPWAQIGLSGQ